MSRKIILIAVVVAIFVLSSSVFIVDQRQQALVLRLGEVSRVIKDAGLHFKVPLIENVVVYDSRLLNIDMEPQEVIANDRKRLIVDAYAKYRIVNPLKFYQSVRTYSGLVLRLNPVLESSLREEAGSISLVDLISTKREEAMAKIKQQINEKAGNYGITVIDVRIVRTDLPSENSRAIYERMKAQHEKEARQTRAEGAEAALRITSAAEKERRVILAEANKEAQILKGEGDSEATQISAAAYNRDPEFYRFYRSMQAYRDSLSPKDTRLILSPDSEFLRYFGDMNGKTHR